jgi:hypothetical protein
MIKENLINNGFGERVVKDDEIVDFEEANGDLEKIDHNWPKRFTNFM